MTKEEFKKLKAGLAAQGAESLADFIANLAMTENRVQEAVNMFVQREIPMDLAKAIRRQISALKREQHVYRYNEAPRLYRRVDDLLDRIEADLLPVAPESALDLLGAFFEADASICERVDDSDGGLGMCFGRAAELFGKASEAAGRPAKAGAWLRRLAKNDNYGVRDGVYDQARALLSENDLRQLIDEWHQQLEAMPQSGDFNYARSSFEVRLIQLCKALGDPDLFAEMRMGGKSPEDIPAYALEVAKLFLKAGQPGRSLEYLPKSSTGRWDSEVDEIKIRIYESLGDQGAANAIRLKSFRSYPSYPGAKEYLDHLPKSDRVAAAAELRRIVDEGDYKWEAKARYYIDSGDSAAAAEIIKRHAVEVCKSNYYTQSEMAKALAADHPVASTILLRGAIEQTLAGAKSKHYHHAVRYIKKLMQLAGKIDDWTGLEPHQDWWFGFVEKHRRKSALVEKLTSAGIALKPQDGNNPGHP